MSSEALARRPRNRGAHKTQYKFAIRQINRARAGVGMPPVQIRTKCCLSCENRFQSFGLGQHLCDNCRKKDGYEP